TIAVVPVWPLLRVTLAASRDPGETVVAPTAATVEAWLAPVVMYQRSAVYCVVVAPTEKLDDAPAPRCQTSMPPFGPRIFRCPHVASLICAAVVNADVISVKMASHTAD